MPPVKRAAGGKTATPEGPPTPATPRKKKDRLENATPKAQPTIAQFFSSPKASSHKVDAIPPKPSPTKPTPGGQGSGKEIKNRGSAEGAESQSRAVSRDSSDRSPGRGTKRPREGEGGARAEVSSDEGNGCRSHTVVRDDSVGLGRSSVVAPRSTEGRRGSDDEINGRGAPGTSGGAFGANGAKETGEGVETRLGTPKTKRKRDKDERTPSAQERLGTLREATPPRKCNGSASLDADANASGSGAMSSDSTSATAASSLAGSRSGAGSSGTTADVGGSNVARSPHGYGARREARDESPCASEQGSATNSVNVVDAAIQGASDKCSSKSTIHGDSAGGTPADRAPLRGVGARDGANANGQKSTESPATEVKSMDVVELSDEAQAKESTWSPKAAAKSVPLEAKSKQDAGPSLPDAEAKSLPMSSETLEMTPRAPLVAAKSLPAASKVSAELPVSTLKVAPAKVAATKSAPTTLAAAKSLAPGSNGEANLVLPSAKSAAKSVPPAVKTAAKSALPENEPPHPQLIKYLSKLAVAVANAEASGNDEERPDKRMGLQEAARSAVATAPAGVEGQLQDAFSEALAPLLARVVQGSMLPLSMLSEEAFRVMKELVPQYACSLTPAKVAEKISLVAQRKCYGAQPKKAVIPEDRSPEAVWRWEVQLMDLLPADKVSVVKQARSERASEGKLVKALVKLTDVMAKHPSDAHRISKEEEKVLVFARKEEVLRQKANLKEAELAEKARARREKEESKEREKKAKEEEKKKRLEEKEAKKAEDKRLKAVAAVEEEKKKQEEAKSGKGSLFNFFKVSEVSQDSKENVAPPLPDQPGGGKLIGSPECAGAQVSGSSEQGSGRFGAGGNDGEGEEGSASGRGGKPPSHMVGGAIGGGGVEVGGGGTGGAGPRSHGGFDAKQLEAFERRLKEGGALEDLLARAAKEPSQRGRKRKAPSGRLHAVEDEEVQVVRPKRIKVTVTTGGGPFGSSGGCEEKQVEICNRMKLLQFHQDHRPPYWGTWSKCSKEVTGRRPLGRDTQGLLNYDYDSEEDWEEEEGQGEDLLSDEEGDKEPEDNLDYKDGWLRQDDEFSDEEKDRFGDADGDEDDLGVDQVRRPIASAVATCDPQATAALGVGAGVRIGAGAAIGGAESSKIMSPASGPAQRAFVSALMFRRAIITDEEMRVQPALLALAAYRALPFPGTMEGELKEETAEASFPIPASDALLDRITGKENSEGDGDEGSGEGRKDDKGKGKGRKQKDVPDELLPALVEKLHGKSDKREDVVNAFVAEYPECTKKAVHQKIKDIATRERGLLGGWVFVVSSSVLETLGVEKEEVPLLPAEPTACASASPGPGDKGKGAAQARASPAPGQRLIMSFFNSSSKGSSAGESAPCPPSSTEEGVHPSCGSAVASVSPAPSVEDVVAPTSVPSTRGDSNDPGRPEVVAEEKNVPEQSSSAAPEDQTHVLSPLREVLENSEDGTAPSSQSSRRQGPDEDGGWEEMKESEPPMGRLVPLCKVLTPCKKVREMAAARPVLYMGSGPPPPPRSVAMRERDDDESMPPPILAPAPARNDARPPESGPEKNDEPTVPDANAKSTLRDDRVPPVESVVKDTGSCGRRGGSSGHEDLSFSDGQRCDESGGGSASGRARSGIGKPNAGIIDQARVLSVLEG